MRAAALLSATAVRERCALVFAAAEREETRHFRIVPSLLNTAADRVVAVTRRRYPDLAVPYHSRWRHFSAGGVDRAALVAPEADIAEQARARIDLAFVSVLLDAGAGAGWRYCEAETGQVLSRSEGLAVASLRAMQQGLFSADPAAPMARRCRRRWRGSRRNVLPTRSSTARATNSSGSTPGRRCCADWVRCAPLIRGGSVRRRVPEISTTIGADSGERWAQARSCVSCSMRSGRSGKAALPSAACRSATAAGTRRFRVTGSYRFTNFRNGLLIHWWNRWRPEAWKSGDLTN